MKMLGKIGGCLVVAMAALGASAAIPGDSLMDILVERLGKDRATIAAECASGAGHSVGLVPAHCFDGIRTKAQGEAAIPGTPVNCSWLATMAQNPYVTLEVPDVAGSIGAVCGYRLTRMVTGYYSRDRAPTAWRIEGSDDGTNWTLIDSRSGVVWPGSQTDPSHSSAVQYDPAQADCEKEFVCSAAKPYRHYRFTPTAAPHTAETGNVGLYEIEYYVVHTYEGMMVVHGIAADDKSGFSCADGDVLTENATVRAPALVSVGDRLSYACVGSVVQELDGGVCVNVQTNRGSTYSFAADGKSYRLTWQWRLQGTVGTIGYRDLLLAIGEPYDVEGGTEGEDFNVGQGPSFCFDGVALTTVSSMRYAAKVGSHATLLVSGGERFGDMAVMPVRYRLWQHSTGYYCNERAPTSWTLEGSNNGEDWVPIDEVVDYTWYAQTNAATYGSGQAVKSPWEKNSADAQLNCVERELNVTESYLSYRLTMTDAKFMEGKAQQWDAGLMEIEIDVRGESKEGADGHLTVANNLDVVGCAPKPGVYQVTKAVGGIDCSAPERVFQDGRLYLCRGYSVEIGSDEGWGAPVTNLGTTAYRYVQGTDDVRLTWIWEHVANRVAVSNEGGRETLTYSRAADYENPDEPGIGYFAVGQTISVAFDTTTAPTPSRFTGEISGDTNGVTVAADRLTFSSDEPRRITAYFERHWQYIPAEENDGESAVTDGNWTLAASPARNSDIVDANGNVFAKAGQYLCFTAGSYRSGSGRLDLTLLNADLAARRETESRAMPLLWLGDKALAGVPQLTELVVPADVVGGFGAPFQQCSNLVSVAFAPSFEYWARTETGETGPFNECTSLVRASMPNARWLSAATFRRCEALRSIELSPQLERIYANAFAGCKGLVELGRIVLPKSLVQIGEGAFKESVLDVLDLSHTKLKYLASAVFQDCPFTRIILPKSVTVVGQAFRYSSDIYWPKSLAIVEFTGAALPDQTSNVPFGNGTSWQIAAVVPGNHVTNYTGMVYLDALRQGQSVFVPKDRIPNVTAQPNYSEVSKYGRHFLGSWYGTWLLSTPRQGLAIFLK